MKTAQDLMNRLSPDALEGLSRAPEIPVAIPAEETIQKPQAGDLDAQVSATQSEDAHQESSAGTPGTTEERVAQEPPKKDKHSTNFRELKAQAEKIARERDEAVRLLREIQQQQQPRQTQSVEEDDDIHIAPDEIAEGKHLSKMGRKIKVLEEKLERYNKQQAMISVETRLNMEFPDFNKVFTNENVKTLAMTYPEIATAISASSDPYAQSKAVYTLIKQFGLHEEEEPQNVAQDIIKRNLAKPKTGASVAAQSGGTNPIGRASDYYSGDLTDEMKKAFYQELVNAKMTRR